jgi:hypothetical protein
MILSGQLSQCTSCQSREEWGSGQHQSARRAALRLQILMAVSNIVVLNDKTHGIAGRCQHSRNEGGNARHNRNRNHLSSAP